MLCVSCRSQYFWFFNCPVLPEILNSANDYEYLDYHLVTGPMGARTKGANTINKIIAECQDNSAGRPPQSCKAVSPLESSGHSSAMTVICWVPV